MSGEPYPRDRDDGPPRPSARGLFEVARTFLRLGCLSFGGPVAHLGYLRSEFVEGSVAVEPVNPTAPRALGVIERLGVHPLELGRRGGRSRARSATKSVGEP